MNVPPLRPTLRLLTSGLVIFGALAGVVGVSRAVLVTNVASATNNTFSTGTASLAIAPDVNGTAGTYSTTIPGFSATGLMPGETKTFKFWLKNTSAIDLNLFADTTNTTYKNGADPITTTGTDLDTKMKLVFNCDVRNSTADGSTPTKTVGTWETTVTPDQFDVGGVAKLGSTSTTSNEAQCTMVVTLDSDSASANQTAIFDAQFTGQQIATPTASPTPSASPTATP